MRQSEAALTKTEPSPPGAEDVRTNERVRAYIEIADSYLEAIGYTEHGFRHVSIVSEGAGGILASLGLPERDVELARVAGLLHDIGNMAGRVQHHRLGALLAKEVMLDMGFPLREIGRVMAAIVIHEEDEGVMQFDPVAAALVIADKSDVHRSRVRTSGSIKEDIHDRVNYAATYASVSADPVERAVTLSLTIDTTISQVIEYFEIFLSRMGACRKAAQSLGCEFRIVINNQRLG